MNPWPYDPILRGKDGCEKEVSMSTTTRRTTLQDVAKDANVSIMAVSLVINGARSNTRLSDTTRERIREAAHRLGYTPNIEAQALSRHRLGKTKVVVQIAGCDEASSTRATDVEY